MKRLLNLTLSPASKKLLIFSVSFTVFYFLNVAIDIACGPEPDPYDYFVSFFHNNIQKTNDYKSFYYNGDIFLNDDNNPVSEQELNAKEWAGYLGHKVKATDVTNAMYNLADSVESRLYNKFLVYNKLPDSLRKNTFLKALVAPSKKSELKYYLFVQGVENLTHLTDHWYPAPRDTVKLVQKANEALKYASQNNNAFLRLRYYYSAQRLFYFAGNYKTGAAIYKKHILPVKSNSRIKLWALDLYAGDEMHLGNKKLAAYLYLKVLMLCAERRVQAFHDFESLNIPDTDVIKLTKNRSEKATIYAIKGFHTPAMSLMALKQVYQTDPKSDLVSVLLLREINKIEEGYLTPRLKGKNYYERIGYYYQKRFDSLKNRYLSYIPQLQLFCTQLARERKCTEPELGYLAAAYLSWVKGDTKSGFSYLNLINSKRLRSKLYDEEQMINLLLLSKSIKRMDTIAESRLVPSLVWLDKAVRKERAIKNSLWEFKRYKDKFYSASARDFYEVVLAPVYLKQKDTAMAALCILKSQRTIPVIERYRMNARLGFDLPEFWQNQLRSYDIQKILRWSRSGSNSSFMNLLIDNIEKVTTVIISNDKPFNGGGYVYAETRHLEKTVKPAIYDLLGTVYLREHNYRAAVKAFKHINAQQLENSTSLTIDYGHHRLYHNYPNAFIDQLKDYPNVYSKKKEKGYSKLSFAKIMAELQQQIKADPKHAAKSYYQMGLGLYNSSYAGNAWYYTAYQWADSDKYRTNKMYYDHDYLQHYTAERYFLKAGKLSNDSEFKARCTFMAARCAQSKIDPPNEYEEYLIDKKLDIDKPNAKAKDYDLTVRRNPYFKTLKQQYRNTKFYTIAVNECSYFHDFIAGYPPKKEPVKRVIVTGR